MQLIVHDLKNPITCALGSISCLLQDGIEREDRNKLLNLALNSCRSEITLIDELLQVDQLELADVSPQKIAVNLQRFLESCSEEIRGSAVLKDIRISTRCDLLPDLYADPDLLRRVLMNLLRNSLKYTLPGGHISLQAGCRENQFWLEVSDTGTGIPADHVPKLFNKFYRVEGKSQANHQGTGLGLYFCRLAVEAHGGKIVLKSQMGKGTTVFVTLPRDQTAFAGRKNS